MLEERGLNAGPCGRYIVDFCQWWLGNGWAELGEEVCAYSYSHGGVANHDDNGSVGGCM